VDHPKTAAQRQLGKMFICRHLETAAQRQLEKMFICRSS
jgi:hypothetical protein